MECGTTAGPVGQSSLPNREFDKHLRKAIAILKSRSGWQAAESLCTVNLQLEDGAHKVLPRPIGEKALADFNIKAECFLALVEDVESRDAYGWLLAHFQLSAAAHFRGTQIEQQFEERAQYWWEKAYNQAYHKDSSLSQPLPSETFGGKITRLDHWLQRLLLDTGNQSVDATANPAQGSQGTQPVPVEAGVVTRKGKPGPQPDITTARKVAEIVRRVAGQEAWKHKLDHVCEALDEERIPFPKRWRQREPGIRSWWVAATTDKELAVKAITYRLKLAKG